MSSKNTESKPLKTMLVNELRLLVPDCKDLNLRSWLKHQIQILEKTDSTDLPETYFEMVGILRLICYKLIEGDKKLFSVGNAKTEGLRTLINVFLAQIEVAPPEPQEKFTAMVKKVYQEEITHHINVTLAHKKSRDQKSS